MTAFRSLMACLKRCEVRERDGRVILEADAPEVLMRSLDDFYGEFKSNLFGLLGDRSMDEARDYSRRIEIVLDRYIRNYPSMDDFLQRFKEYSGSDSWRTVCDTYSVLLAIILNFRADINRLWQEIVYIDTHSIYYNDQLTIKPTLPSFSLLIGKIKRDQLLGDCYNYLLQHKLVHRDSSFDDFRGIFDNPAPTQAVLWSGRLNQLKYLINSLMTHQIIEKRKNYLEVASQYFKRLYNGQVVAITTNQLKSAREDEITLQNKQAIEEAVALMKG